MSHSDQLNQSFELWERCVEMLEEHSAQKTEKGKIPPQVRPSDTELLTLRASCCFQASNFSRFSEVWLLMLGWFLIYKSSTALSKT